MIDFFIKIKQQQKQQLPFVVYRKPKKNKVIGFFQKNDHLYFSEDFSEQGFVFAPFDADQIILIPTSQSDVESVVYVDEKRMISNDRHYGIEKNSQNSSEAKIDFEKLVCDAVSQIKKGSFDKVVLSRVEKIELDSFDIVDVLEKLLSKHANAFVYCWYHPKIGLWIGATPERLLKSKGGQFSTVALAGTQVASNTEVVWQSKEIKEQQYVTDFIIDNLKNYTSEIEISSPYTLKAGKICHIKTDIQGVIRENSNLKEILSVLHPTPATCGLPKSVAKRYIVENEGYDRQYYTGFLGELNSKYSNSISLKSDFFVNLRCMNIKEYFANIYIGCGITAESSPESEWYETVNKSTTMKEVLNIK